MAEPPAPSATSPRIKLTGLHVAGYRSLRRVDWPEDGLGWGGAVPDTVLVGGLNGSGKTTLLEVIFAAVSSLIAREQDEASAEQKRRLMPLASTRLEIDLTLLDTHLTIRADPTDGVLAETWSVSLAGASKPLERREVRELLYDLQRRLFGHNKPRLVYFPTDRAVPFPPTRFKRPGLSDGTVGTVYRYSAPTEWDASVEAILYGARWRDLNAKEGGQPEMATNFAAFAAVMERFFGPGKSFFWDAAGVLHVRTDDGTLHPLDFLSSGEKQVLLFAAELVRRWTPGSLVLIDEPELHLHEAWLAALWMLIRELQQERGGQVIVTTQSNYLWGLAEPGTQVLLGGRKRA